MSHRRRKMRALGALIGASALSLAVAMPASATWADTTPESQTHNHGVKSSWTLQWGSNGPYNVQFHYGDGTHTSWVGTSLTGVIRTRAFYPCNDHTYTQSLQVLDEQDIYASDSTTAKELGGSPC